MDSGLRLQDNIPIKWNTQYLNLNRSLIPTSKGEVYLCFVSKHKNNLVSKYYTSICNTQVKVHVIHVLHKIALNCWPKTDPLHDNSNPLETGGGRAKVETEAGTRT